MFSKASSPAAREREEERGKQEVCWDNWIEAIRRRKEGIS